MYEIVKKQGVPVTRVGGDFAPPPPLADNPAVNHFKTECTGKATEMENSSAQNCRTPSIIFYNEKMSGVKKGTEYEGAKKSTKNENAS